jgi:hypothetical protein
MARVQETAASIVVSPILIAMPQNSDQFIFFLDTPRAAGGLNHRYFVASLLNNDESKITHYATLARENLIGRDYIAVSRTAAQVSRGQEREGLELLVLAGISTANETHTAQLLQVLGTMLDSMPDAPVPVEQSSKGLLLPSRRIADMECELRAELNQNINPPSERLAANAKAARHTRAANTRGRYFLLCIAVACGTLLGIAAGVWKLSHWQTETPSTNKPNPGKGHPVSPSAEEHQRGDWRFLENDLKWTNLGRVTGLPDDWNAATAASWATQLLKEADPLAVITNEFIKPDDIHNNSKVGLLLSSVEHVMESGSPVVDSSVSKEWLRLSGNDASKLNNLFRDLTPGGADGKNIGTLKICLLEWSRAVIAFADDNAGVHDALKVEATRNADSLRKLIVAQSGAIPVLVNADLMRLEFVTGFLNGEDFAKAVEESAYGKDWRSREWPERLKQLHDMSTDGKLNPAVKRLVVRLDAAATPLRIQSKGGQ